MFETQIREIFEKAFPDMDTRLVQDEVCDLIEDEINEAFDAGYFDAEARYAE